MVIFVLMKYFKPNIMKIEKGEIEFKAVPKFERELRH
jgi:hypothetical protein